MCVGGRQIYCKKKENYSTGLGSVISSDEFTEASDPSLTCIGKEIYSILNCKPGNGKCLTSNFDNFVL